MEWNRLLLRTNTLGHHVSASPQRGYSLRIISEAAPGVLLHAACVQCNDCTLTALTMLLFVSAAHIPPPPLRKHRLV